MACEAAARRHGQGGPHHLALRRSLAEPRRSRAARRACRAAHAQAPPLAPPHRPPPAPLRVADGGRAAHAAAAAGVAAVLLPKRAVRGPKGRGGQVVPPARQRVRLFRRVRAAAAAPAAPAAGRPDKVLEEQAAEEVVEVARADSDVLRASSAVGAATTRSEPRSDVGATFDKMLSLAPGTHTEEELLGAAISAFTDAGWA
mmetsp:Transcript_37868/g.122447  ORF Transcript_37868/g.122447 Transcript_37868/m.122447 type:complete len:201 (+) Transcript_37868:680-1282(+)